MENTIETRNQFAQGAIDSLAHSRKAERAALGMMVRALISDALLMQDEISNEAQTEQRQAIEHQHFVWQSEFKQACINAHSNTTPDVVKGTDEYKQRDASRVKIGRYLKAELAQYTDIKWAKSQNEEAKVKRAARAGGKAAKAPEKKKEQKPAATNWQKEFKAQVEQLEQVGEKFIPAGKLEQFRNVFAAFMASLDEVIK